MSLDWNLTKIKNSDTICWEKDENDNDKLNPVTESLICTAAEVPLQLSAASMASTV